MHSIMSDKEDYKWYFLSYNVLYCISRSLKLQKYDLLLIFWCNAQDFNLMLSGGTNLKGFRDTRFVTSIGNRSSFNLSRRVDHMLSFDL